MTTEYNSYRYLYGPRPVAKPISPLSIKLMTKLKYIAQKKKNGTYTLIFCRGNEVIFKTREPNNSNAEHKAWTPNDKHRQFFSVLGSNWNVFCAELLHSKGPSIKNELFIHDQIVHDGKYLVDTTFMERQKLLADRWGKVWKDEGDQFRVHQHVTVAKVFTTGCEELFEHLGPLDEGLVFKLPNAKLQPCVSDSSNSSWQAKCRIAKSKTYSF